MLVVSVVAVFLSKQLIFHGFILLAGVQDSLIFGITPVCSGLDA